MKNKRNIKHRTGSVLRQKDNEKQQECEDKETIWNKGEVKEKYTFR